MTHQYMHVSDVHALEERPDAINREILHDLIIQVEKQVKVAVAIGMTKINYQLPLIDFDHPSYDVKVIMPMLVHHLKQRGFEVAQLPRSGLLIRWRNDKASEPKKRPVKDVLRPLKAYQRETRGAISYHVGLEF